VTWQGWERSEGYRAVGSAPRLWKRCVNAPVSPNQVRLMVQPPCCVLLHQAWAGWLSAALSNVVLPLIPACSCPWHQQCCDRLGVLP